MNKINSNFDGQTIFVGMDVHKSSWNLGIHLNDMFIKNIHQKPNPIFLQGIFPEIWECRQDLRPGIQSLNMLVVVVSRN
jgi:hypothetical protein